VDAFSLEVQLPVCSVLVTFTLNQQDLVRGALKIMGSKVAPAGTKGWKPLVCFDKEMRTWSWIGPPPFPLASSSSQVRLMFHVFHV